MAQLAPRVSCWGQKKERKSKQHTLEGRKDPCSAISGTETSSSIPWPYFALKQGHDLRGLIEGPCRSASNLVSRAEELICYMAANKPTGSSDKNRQYCRDAEQGLGMQTCRLARVFNTTLLFEKFILADW